MENKTVALKILRLTEKRTSDYNGDNFPIGIEFQIDRKNDALMAQRIFRGLICLEGSEVLFGYNPDFEEVLEFNYKCGVSVNRLIYNGEGKIALEIITKKNN